MNSLQRLVTQLQRKRQLAEIVEEMHRSDPVDAKAFLRDLLSTLDQGKQADEPIHDASSRDLARNKVIHAFLETENRSMTKEQIAYASGVRAGTVHSLIYNICPDIFEKTGRDGRKMTFRLEESVYTNAKSGGGK